MEEEKEKKSLSEIITGRKRTKLVQVTAKSAEDLVITIKY